jgi:hypothetical protein
MSVIKTVGMMAIGFGFNAVWLFFTWLLTPSRGIV